MHCPEVVDISRNIAPIHVIVHEPKTDEGKRELEKRAADVHADLVYHSIQKLDCPSPQKEALLDAVIRSAAGHRR